MSIRHAVNEVFTPRRTDVNREIYVDRPELEKELRRALEGSLHAIVFGESGSGKSWLYKKVLGDMNVQIATANCANALRFGSLTNEIRQVTGIEIPKRLASMSEEKHAAVKIPIAEGGLKSTRKFDFAEVDPLLECFRFLRDKAGDKNAILVVDNLEMIFRSEKIMEELASLITLLDDSRYAKYNVKLLIVGVPSGVRDYLSQMHASVGNRVAEISEVSSLSEQQVSTLVRKGFIDLLKVNIDQAMLQMWQTHIFEVTMGFAQPVQEYCEQLAYVVEDADWNATMANLDTADNQWLKQGLSQASATIALLMNERETKIGRRNQVLYILGRINKRIFHVNDIESTLRVEFPASTEGTTLAVGQILSELSGGDTPIIKHSAKGPTYEFRDARFAMALRVLLQKEGAKEKITKLG